MNSGRDSTARLRAGLNPLLTASLFQGHGHLNSAPLSAVSMTSQSTMSASQTPIQRYNPQEWAPATGGPDQRPHFFPDARSSPPPPPPYSPPRSQRPVSMSFDGVQVANMSVARAPPPPPLAHRLAAEQPLPSPSFPPPPGGRGSSRERRFGLPSLGRRRESEQATTTHPEHHQAHPFPAAIPLRPQHVPVAPLAPLALHIPQRSESESSQNMAPGSRRAASTPAISTPTSARSRSSSQVRWDPAMPLPPPPPGPPPSASRSTSANRPNSGLASGPNPSSDAIVSPPTRRPPPSGVTALGPVPPTPQNWVDNDNDGENSQQDIIMVLSSETYAAEVPNVQAPMASPDFSSSASNPSPGLARALAVRGEKSLRERRNESRTRGTRDSIDASIGKSLSDIIVPSDAAGPSSRLTVTGGTPRSGRSSSNTPQTGEASTSAKSGEYPDGLTPKALDPAQQPSSGRQTPATPFSPRPNRTQPTPEGSQFLVAPKTVPTTPVQSRPSSSRSQQKMKLEVIVPTPLSPSKAVTKQSAVAQTTEQFTLATIERFQAFAQKEAAAADDAERVRLFAGFFVSESRIRRERYAGAIGALGSEILDLTRDLFRPMAARRESVNSSTNASAVEFTPQTSEPRSHRGSMSSVFLPGEKHPSSAPPSAGIPPSPGSPSPGGNVNPSWQPSNYMPSLSPILSMSISDANEHSSRGRPSSRWWESESNGVGQSGKIERSRRESKYMGVAKEDLEALQWLDDPNSASGPSKRDSSGEALPEKTGWHEPEDTGTPQPLPDRRYSQAMTASAPNTPSPAHLDISRLVTLPPPYPRHHPAVNNNHPKLTQMRHAVRALTDMSELDAIQERFRQDSAQRCAQASEAAKQRKQDLRANLQREIGSGNIGFEEAAAIEADFTAGEQAKVKDLAKTEFDAFQTVVVVPVNDLLQGRITRATELFDELRGRLFVETRAQNPNLPQEEGDEEPELLEKLTLLKWLFEAREMLHRAVYDLLTERNDRYGDVVLTPYRLAANADKVASATAFFAEDAAKRALAAAEETLRRTREFRDVVEENVVRGVEAQLGAFWDIAPSLKRLLEQVPPWGRLAAFAVHVPPAELAENPTYAAHPLQYLFSLLLHAEKSTHQFIESQTNLLCLLHEVREAVVTAHARAMELEGREAPRIEATRTEEMARLTDDLKDKVRLVQDQWNAALGDCIRGVKERVGGWLLETGGWDESLEDGEVGGC